MQTEFSRDVPADAEGGRSDRARSADPPSVTGVELRRSPTAVTHTGRGSVPVPVPSRPPPIRRPGLDWSRAGRDVPEGEVVKFGVVLLGQDERPTTVLHSWATVQEAEEYARDHVGGTGTG